MATPRDKLRSGQQNYAEDGFTVSMKPNKPRPIIKLQVPEIKIPEIRVPASDMAPVAQAINQLGQAMRQIAEQQTKLLQAIEKIADRPAPSIKMPAPAKRPSRFYVELDKEGSETVGMQISTED